MLTLKTKLALIIYLALALNLTSLNFANAQSRITVGVTETIDTHNPYGDSVSLMYGIWSEITGPFCTYSYANSPW